MKASPEFMLAKKMALSVRLGWVAALAIVGVAVQLLFSVALGWPLVFVAILLGLPAGKSNEPRLTAAGDWQNVTSAEFETAIKLLSIKEAAVRPANLFSATAGSGCGLTILLLVCVGVTTAVIYGAADQGVSGDSAFRPVVQGGSLAFLFLIDSLTLLLPLWLLGRVKAWEPPEIRLKIEQLIHIYGRMASEPGLECQPCLRVARSAEGSVPTDCKLMYKLKDADPAFMGIQVQTSLNDVQGRKYPYTYCVLIAKPEFGLIEKAEQVVELPPRGGFGLPWGGLFSDSNAKKESKFARFANAVVELKNEGEVDIAVVRQNTSGTGYTTSKEAALGVFQCAYDLANLMLVRAG